MGGHDCRTRHPYPQHHTRRHLDEARTRLTAERVAAASRIAALQRDVDDIVESAKGGATDDEHDAEGATIAFERAQAMALLEETRLQVEHPRRGPRPGRRRQLRQLRVLRQNPIAAERLAARPRRATLPLTLRTFTCDLVHRPPQCAPACRGRRSQTIMKGDGRAAMVVGPFG